MTHLYAIGLGSNRRHGRHGAPADVVRAVLRELHPVAASRIVQTAPLGPSSRRFANAVALIETPLAPPALLAALKAMERGFGRRRGRRWGERVIDLDILLWSGGRWASRSLAIPHPRLAERRFALEPLAAIAPDWQVPRAGAVRHLAARLTRPRPIHRSSRRSGP